MEHKTYFKIGPRTRHDILKGKNIRKLEDGGDIFDDYWTDSSDVSSILSQSKKLNTSSKALQLLNVEASNFISSGERNCSFRKKPNHSPVKSQEVLCNDYVNVVEVENLNKNSPVKSQEVCNDYENVVEVENLNKRSCTDVYEDISANFEVNGGDQQIEALKTVLNNDDKNNSSSELVEMASIVLKEVKVINNSPLSQTYTKKNEIASTILKENEVLNNSLLSQTYTKKNEMTSTILKENEVLNNSPLSQTYTKKNEMPRHISRTSVKTSKKSISRSTQINPKLQQPQLQYDEYDEQIMLMVHMKENETITIPSSSKKELLLTPQPSFIEVDKENIKASEKSQQEECMSCESQNHNVSPSKSIQRNMESQNESLNNPESVSSENIQINETENESGSALKNYFNTATNSHESTNDCVIKVINDQTKIIDHKENNGGVGEKNDLAEKHLSNTVVFEKTLASSPKDNLIFESRETNTDDELCNSKTNAKIKPLNDEICNASKNTFSDTSSMDNNTSQVYVIEKEKMQTNEKISFTPDQNIFEPYDSIQISIAKKHKLPIKKRNSLIPKEDLPNIIMTTCKNSDNDISKVNVKKTDKKNKKIKNDKSMQTVVTNKSDCIVEPPVENVLKAVDSHDLSHVEISKKLNTRKNITFNKSGSMTLQNNLEMADSYDLRPLQTSIKQTALIERNSVILERADPTNTSKNTIKNSVKNISKISPKNKNSRSRKNPIVSKRSIIDENILQAAHSDDSSRLQTTKRQKKSANERNISVSGEDFIASVSRNTFDSHSISSVSEINAKETQKQKKIKNNESRQTAARNKTDFVTVGNNRVVVDLDNFSGLSEQQISKKRKKISKKSILTSLKNSSIKAHSKMNQMITFRRSSREKYKPLAHWQNERLLYRFEDGEIKTLGIDKGTKEDLGDLRPLQTSIKQTALIERNSEKLERADPTNTSKNTIKNSAKNISKISPKNKNSTSRKNSIVSKRSIIDENILQAAHSDDSSQLQTTKRQKKSAKERNISVSGEDFIASVSRNTFDSHSISSVSEINAKETQKQKKIKNNESRQTAATNKKDFLTVGNNRVVVDLDSFSGLSKQQISKKRKKVSKKSILTSLKNSSIKAHSKMKQMITLRRSSREKYKPLAHWRNERLLYRFENGEIKTLGIDKGTKEDLGGLQQLWNNKKLQKKEKLHKKEKILKPKKAKVLDVIQKKEKFIEVQKKFLLVPWDSSVHSKTKGNSESPFLIKRMFETKGNSFGYLKIGVGKSKPPQFMPEQDLQLTVLNGTLEVHIHKQVYTLESKDMFIVPRGSAYNIINIGKNSALLSYTVGKFKFFEYEY